MTKRPDILDGATYELVVDDDVSIFVTINSSDGKPFEVFVRDDDAALYEWIAALTILITRLLRAGQSLQDIGSELEEIHGPESRHMIPGTNIQSPSFVARVGRILRIHAQKLQEKNDGARNNQE